MPHAAFNVGEYINLRLMKRAQGSLTAFPVDEAKLSRETLLNISETKVNTVYSKLLLANSAEVIINDYNFIRVGLTRLLLLGMKFDFVLYTLFSKAGNSERVEGGLQHNYKIWKLKPIISNFLFLYFR